MIPFMENVQKRQIYADRKQVSGRLGSRGENGGELKTGMRNPTEGMNTF